MKRIFKISIILVIVTALIFPIKNAMATEEKECKVYINGTEKIEAGNTITINIGIKEVKKEIDTIVATLEYDRDIFEEVTENDIEIQNNWSYPIYNSEDGIFMIDKTDSTTNDELIMKVTLKVKEGITEEKATIKLTDIEVSGLGKEIAANTEEIFEIGNPDKTEKLYLTSEIYKISDQYVSRVNAETNLKDYINNLKTNGQITITKEDGTKLTEDEYVGTGMKLTVTKDEEKIELKIAVSGDLNGDGKVTATDLSTMNQAILKTITLENEYKLAGDLDENDKITATDLSTINNTILKNIKLTYDKNLDKKTNE